MIQINGLSRHYGEFKAVNDVSFEIKQKEVVGLLGHNGAGKTTIMKMLTGYLEPTSGSITVGEMKVGEKTAAIQKRIGYLPENCPLWPEMTVIDYLEYQATLHGISASAQLQSVARAIGRTGLTEKADQLIGTLSRGYRQRVGVAQAILHDPDIIILDEPTNGLDPVQITQMRKLIRELAENATIILSTHILQEVQAVCDRVLIMHAGQIAVDSQLKELQTGQHLTVTVNTPGAASYLNTIEGITKPVGEPVEEGGHYLYTVQAANDLAPAIARAVVEAGDQLYGLQQEMHTLETVFAQVNVAGTMETREAAHA
ncbi:MAG: multidrug ABC transporter ATP-binding protein [Desulfobulbus propionicus]|nr:MAG: multidrug ABC transporter ATP-binding protein [Desulfobulbus propionicus]